MDDGPFALRASRSLPVSGCRGHSSSTRPRTREGACAALFITVNARVGYGEKTVPCSKTIRCCLSGGKALVAVTLTLKPSTTSGP